MTCLGSNSLIATLPTSADMPAEVSIRKLATGGSARGGRAVKGVAVKVDAAQGESPPPTPPLPRVKPI